MSDAASQDQLPAGAGAAGGTSAQASPAAGLAQAVGFTPATTERLGRDAPFEPVGESRAWLVTDGAVDLFLASPLAGGRPGARRHLARIEAGGLIVGLPAPRDGGSLHAVPTSDGKVAAGTLAALLTVEGPAAGQVPGLIEGWVDALTVALALPAPPRDAAVLKAGETTDGKAAAAFVTGDETAWVAAPPGDADFAGGGPLGKRAWTGRHLPLANGGWLTLGTAARLESRTTGDWLKQGSAAADLAAYAGLTLALFAEQSGRDEQAAVARLARRDSEQARHLSAGAQSLAAIIEQRRPTTGVTATDPLIAVLEAAAGDLGVTLVPPRGGLSAVPKDQDPVLYLCARSAVQCRRVAMPDDWQRDDYGPLVAHYGPSNRPCALLPNDMGRYRLVDPTAGIDTLVTPAIARQIAPVVYLLYKPLPEGRIDGRGLLSYSVPGNARDFVMIVAMVLLAGIASIVTPIATGYIVSTIIPSAERGQLLVLGLVVLASLLGAAAFNFVQSIAMLRIEGRLDQRVEAAVWDRLLKLRAPFFRQYSVGDLANRAQSISQIRQLITGSVINSSISGIMGLFSLGLMIAYDWLLGLLVGVVSLLYAFSGYLIGRTIVGLNRKRIFLDGKVQGLLFQLLGAIEKLRVTGSEATAFGLWEHDYLTYARLTNRQNGWTNLSKVMAGVFPFLAVVIVLLVIGWQSGQLDAFFTFPRDWQTIEAAAFSNIMSPGDFSAFITAYVQFTTAIIGLVGVAVQLTLVGPLLERITPILQAEEENDSGKKDPGEIKGAVELRSIRFGYGAGSPPVLNDLSLSIEPGEFVAFVGPSGSGKSTVIRLLLGFERPDAGSVLIDGVDLATLNSRLVRQNLGVVLQDAKLLSGTIFDNIAAGSDATREEAWDAARRAGFDEDVKSMPMGMDTYLTDAATTVSGGQRQRLMIARALVRNPRILIFDEATSALDNETQAIVSRGVDELPCTRIAIAHRLSTIRRADRIFVIDGGRVVESGSYEELMARQGTFAELVKRQVA
ncbi:NHLM bacteriocin system ABC transporter, ATP-binding protein [Tistlia consotensis]|uniref:NHLM bacteriocin system ABC transporter, ATP-binding protein n=1 Tax=Tistlia consotensis USBA 355 TaxID=560819 RepID=A0A1Y6BHE3_9PROT|nr:NHLP bacteriocin export ABC transporter permease/ATPase subunit [Tistlia consotensis]SMF04123.1 NHLM bacteriocin system ABC transporter, ATP-binding protein [Tistlia consotensis USBA 355]SNR54262.1 NHLM bacteriocin system ABC transporter, ATP-binding protein [Tistlia consotensis]